MPQRKKGRQNNKKKNNKKNNKAGNNGNGNGNGYGGAPNTARQAPVGQCLEGQRPSHFSENINGHDSRQDNVPSFYVRYKEATKRLIDYMIQKTPEYVEGNRKSVNFIVVAADWMAESATSGSFVLDSSILKDLKISIRMRSRAAKSIFGGENTGHVHLLSCLVYCWTILVSLPRSRKHDNKQDQTEEEIANSNRFEALMEEEDEDEEETDEEMFPSTPVPRPEPMPEVALTIEELKTADDRNDIILFLLNLDDLMGMVRTQYSVLSKNLLYHKSQSAPTPAMVEETIEGAVATNMLIQQVQQLEMELQQQHPHLTTPYRMLSTLVLPEMAQYLAYIVREHGDSTSSSELEHGRGLKKEIAIFLGDCLECHFRSRSDSFNKSDTVIKDFCTRLKINESGASEIQKMFKGIEILVMFEAPMYPEVKTTRTMYKNAQSKFPGHTSVLPPGSSWLATENMPNIGGDRSIIHTLRLLQKFSATITDTPDDIQIEPKRGSYGPTPWRAGHTQKIRGDLDELFMSDILPQWVLMCRNGIMGKAELPRENNILALFVLMRQFVNTPGSPVSFSLAFGMHAMLTSILETDKIFNGSLDVYERVFNNYFDQLESVSNVLKQEPDTEILKNKTWTQNMTMVAFLKNFGLDVFNKRALWNPLCAGTTFSILCFFGNLEAGCAMIDCQVQLRMTLHLFHALKINGIIEEGQVPILDWIHNCFKKSRGVWEGPLPRRGELVQRFWICFGLNVTDAKKMADRSKLSVQRRKVFVDTHEEDWETRRIKPIDPAAIAKCYHRIRNHDFHDVVDKYHSDDQRRRMKGTEIYSCAVRAHDILDAIDDEQQLLALNLPVCGGMMEQFVCSLGRMLNWGPILDPLDDHKRQGYVMVFAQHLLGILDFADDPLTHDFQSAPVGEWAAKFMSSFFNNLDPPNVAWFQSFERNA